jgi:hypothetical protein
MIIKKPNYQLPSHTKQIPHEFVYETSISVSDSDKRGLQGDYPHVDYDIAYVDSTNNLNLS